MDQVLPKLHGVVCYIDDIVVTGRNDEEHLAHLESVLEILQQNGLRIKDSKCFFLQDSIEYLGRVISKEGIQTSRIKIEAVTKVKPPNDQTDLRFFLGLVNHYGKFIRCLAELSSPLNNLLRRDVPWIWSKECQESFKKLREALTSTDVVAQYNPDIPLGLACDASAVGIGAVIYHKHEDGSERPIAYASKTLSDAERNYSQIERGTQHYFWSKEISSISIRTKILSPDRSQAATYYLQSQERNSNHGSQRWATILSEYSYDIEYKPTKEHGEEALTRSFIPTSIDRTS